MKDVNKLLINKYINDFPFFGFTGSRGNTYICWCGDIGWCWFSFGSISGHRFRFISFDIMFLGMFCIIAWVLCSVDGSKYILLYNRLEYIYKLYFYYSFWVLVHLQWYVKLYSWYVLPPWKVIILIWPDKEYKILGRRN